MTTTPEDHKPGLFTFEHDGKTYSFEKGFDHVRAPRFLRANRRRDPLDLLFTILEDVAGKKALEAVDDMGEDEFRDFAEAVEKAMDAEAKLGESSRS